ncbi:MAG: hypothetical protein ACFN02_03910 [Olsenella profusa]
MHATRHTHPAPSVIQVRGARVHNLKDVDVDVPLGRLVGVAGVSGSGKSSLALGVLYAEGSRRYMEALSTYTRRRLTQSARADVDAVLHVPAALALRQRPGIPDVRSTFGTQTELLNHLRLLFSRVGTYRCPSCGSDVGPSMNVSLERDLVCPACGHRFSGRGAEEMAFNSGGACPTCQGMGVLHVVDEATLVPDETKTIEEGAVRPWGSLMWSLMVDIARDMGVRTDVPFSELTPQERDVVFHGPAEKHHLLYHNEKTNTAGEMDFTYYNAVYSVENALSKVKDEKGLKRVARFLKEEACPECGGTRLCPEALSIRICGENLGQATERTLDELAAWLPGVAPTLPDDVRPMAEAIIGEMGEPILRLQELGLGYLSLDRASSTLSTGERQRVQLTRAVRNRTTGVLYVLDEPSIGLHPANVDGLLGVMDDLVADGNSVVVVDHDVRVLREVDHLIEVGPSSGDDGGRVIAQGTIDEVERTHGSRIAGFLTGERRVRARGLHPPRDRCHPHGQAAGGGRAARASRLRHGRLGLRQDHPGAREPRAGAAGIPGGRAAAWARAAGGCGWHQARDAHRRHAHRGKRALHGGHVLGCAGRPAPRLCRHHRRQETRSQDGGVLLQHGKPALSHLRRDGSDLARRAVSARCRHTLSRLPRQPLCAGGMGRAPPHHAQRRRGEGRVCLAARAHGDDGRPGPGKGGEPQEGKKET